MFRLLLLICLFISGAASSNDLWLKISEASKVYDYQINLLSVIKLWRGGCIIQSEMLGDLAVSFEKEAIVHIFESSHFKPNLKETLEGKGRFTAFAPNDAAFNALGDEVLESLFKAENRAVLKEVISYHVMPGSQGVNELTRAVNGNGGEARLKTLNGSTLNVRLNGDKVVIVGANGAKATIVSGDKVQNNGMVHTINTVVMPN